jgi:hypothetical protein
LKNKPKDSPTKSMTSTNASEPKVPFNKLPKTDYPETLPSTTKTSNSARPSTTNTVLPVNSENKN